MDIQLQSWALALLGGALAGTSTALLLALEGVNEGVSGMAAGLARGAGGERARRAAFLLGLAAVGGTYHLFAPQAFANHSGRPLLAFALAGVLIGYGARLANGCTSGHGVLGVSRGAARSFVAVLLFGLGALSVQRFFAVPWVSSAHTQPAEPSPHARRAVCGEPAPCVAHEEGGLP